MAARGDAQDDFTLAVLLKRLGEGNATLLEFLQRAVPKEPYIVQRVEDLGSYPAAIFSFLVHMTNNRPIRSIYIENNASALPASVFAGTATGGTPLVTAAKATYRIVNVNEQVHTVTVVATGQAGTSGLLRVVLYDDVLPPAIGAVV